MTFNKNLPIILKRALGYSKERFQRDPGSEAHGVCWRPTSTEAPDSLSPDVLRLLTCCVLPTLGGTGDNHTPHSTPRGQALKTLVGPSHREDNSVPHCPPQTRRPDPKAPQDLVYSLPLLQRPILKWFLFLTKAPSLTQR